MKSNKKCTINFRALKTLCKRWGKLFLIILDPFAMILSLLVFYLFRLQNMQNNPNILFIINLCISLLIGLLGGILAKKWDDLTETKVIDIRGKSACRNLRLLLSRSIELEKRVIEYLNRFTKNENSISISDELLRTYFEEIIYECVNLDEIIINSIEDWKDLIPEESIKPIIDEIKILKERILINKKRLENIQKAGQEKQVIKKIKADYDNLNDLTASSGLNFTTGSLITGGTITENTNLGDPMNPYNPS